MTDEEFQEIANLVTARCTTTSEIEFRVYYDDSGKVLTYTSEKLSGNYLIITKEQYSEARADAVVKDGQLHHTHIVSHVYKLTRNSTDGVKTSKYDINILSDTGDTTFWNYTAYEIQ
jgi:DNA mismatch repair ATPase MutL